MGVIIECFNNDMKEELVSEQEVLNSANISQQSVWS